MDQSACLDSPATMEIPEDPVNLDRLDRRVGMVATGRMDSLDCPDCLDRPVSPAFRAHLGAMDQKANRPLDLREQWVKKAMVVSQECRACLANRAETVTQAKRAIVVTLGRRDREDHPASQECQEIQALAALDQKEIRAIKDCPACRVHPVQPHLGWAQKAQ